MLLRKSFSRAIGADPSRIHLTAHSHHLWPDVSFEAHEQAWQDAALLADRKWEKVFGEIIPKAQRHIARHLGLDASDGISFSPNTHDFLVRILSCFPYAKRISIVTTDGEFHSASRQFARLEEEGAAHVTRVPYEPFDSFSARFAAAMANADVDLVFLSHVSFRSGFVVPDFEALVEAAPPSSFFVIDGYHGFCAVPTQLQRIADRAFYVAGGYKYAMSGEGVCFLHAPLGYGERPRVTGWFASFSSLAKGSGVPYSSDGSRFFGATFDPAPLYRFCAVMDWLESEGISVTALRDHARNLSVEFLRQVQAADVHVLTQARLVLPPDSPTRGQFLCFETDDAQAMCEKLLGANIVTDARENRLRIGFGAYHELGEIPAIVKRIREALA